MHTTRRQRSTHDTRKKKIYIYIYTYVFVCTYTYTYTYTKVLPSNRPKAPSPADPSPLRLCTGVRRGTNGVSTNGVTATLMFFERGAFWVLPLTYFYLPKSARAYLFPQSVKTHYLYSDPISVDHIYVYI